MSPALGVYLVTDRALCGARGVVETVRAAVNAGVGAVQLREKGSDASEQLRTLEQLAEVVAGRALLLVNDRLDVAVEARRIGIPVDGVHLGQGDVSVLKARDALGAEGVIGLTANTTAHVRVVEPLPPGTVDYLGVGVIRPTSTKADHPPPLGIRGFARLTAETTLPTVAIGGIRAQDVAVLRGVGAAGVAVVSAICAAADPSEATRSLVARWESGAGPDDRVRASVPT